METKDLIIDDGERGIFRYNRLSFTSPEVLDLERERIFDRCWLYLGHESEVEKPGDFRRRKVAGRPVFFVRGDDDQVRVFLNACPHRGAQVCRRDEGNAKIFQCFYHAWTFNRGGELLRRPDEAGYSHQPDRTDMALRPPPRVDSYRGFYFISFNPRIGDLYTYLAGAREYIDLIADQSEVGLKISRGSNIYTIKSNWKLLVENAMDGYHLLPLHATYFDYISDLVKDIPGESIFKNWAPGVVRLLGNGHVVQESSGKTGRTVAHWHPSMGEDTREEIKSIRERLVERHGEERARRIAETNRGLLIFPNLFINDFIFTIIRVFDPCAPDRTESNAWNLVPGDHSPNLLASRLDNFITFLGPGGLGTPDDTEAAESCQIGAQAGEMAWSDLSKGMHRVSSTADELSMRAFWRYWYGRLNELDQIEMADRIPVGKGA